MSLDSQLSSNAPAGSPTPKFRYSAAPAGAVALGDSPLSPFHAQTWRWIGLSLALGGVCMVLLYSTNLLQLFERWANDAGWSHGFVVPLISLFFIRLKWDKLVELEPAGSMWGLAVLLVGAVDRCSFGQRGWNTCLA